MNQQTRKRLLRYATPALLALFLLAAAVACKDNGDAPDGTESDTLPAVIDTVPDALPDTEPETEAETGPAVEAVVFPSATLPDYARYATTGRIKEVLGSRATYAFTVGGTNYYKNGVLTAGGDGAVERTADGKLTVSGAAVATATGKSGIADGTPEEVAKAIGMGVAVYDKKLVLFYEGAEPLHTYNDLYTYEAMHLYMTAAGEEEIVNAFIDLPDKISNDASNTVFYTAPDIHLGIQTSVYYAQMGQVAGVPLGPSLVAGEGKHEDNYTTVRIFNHQQTVVAQFLAFSPSVMGGVQVAAAGVGEETLIATAAFAHHDGTDGDVRVFDTAGLIRMTIRVQDEFTGPYTIATGHFSSTSKDEVLLVASQKTDAEGKLHYALLSLADGSVIARHTLDCSFALSDGKAQVPVEVSVRNISGGTDTAILYFPTVQGVFEGSVETAEFANAGINLPADATGVSASNQFGEKYIITLPAREDSKNQSFITVYDTDASGGRDLDVGFRENRFFSARYTNGYNDDKYVSQGDFCHIRCDLENGGMAGVPGGSSQAIDAYFDRVTYGSFAHGAAANYANRLKTDYLMLEPCFTHRWNKINATAALAAYADPDTGEHKYVSIGKDGQYIDYNELGNLYYVGTYADGILDLAKVRLYPLRSFLQTTAPAFRGEGANPEHLVGMSPVHEHEINVPGSVGDYNPYMVEGFRQYMVARYGSIEAINRTFGTDFATLDDMDPPRDQGRGEWDVCANGNEYLTEWSMYNRYIVSKRIMEAYREALIAGYPPESISAHQMPEGEAVAGFLGDAATRLTPVDVVLTCGTAYGGTRYGNIISDSYSFIRFAERLGHRSITMGEYCVRSASASDTYAQLKDFWTRGLRMVHHITLGDAGFEAAEADAMRRLIEENQPRPGYTGGTTNAVGVQQEGKDYRIVQIGAGDDTRSIGLLKSVNADGSWEGTVYVVPFHTKMAAKDIEVIRTPVGDSSNRYSTGALETLKNTDQVEVTLQAASTTEGATITFEVYHKGCRLDQATTSYTLTDTLTPYRFVLSNQLYENGLEVVVTIDNGSGSADGVTLQDLTATLQTQKADFLYYSGTRAMRNCSSHVGGVTFDLLDRDMKD